MNKYKCKIKYSSIIMYKFPLNLPSTILRPQTNYAENFITLRHLLHFQIFSQLTIKKGGKKASHNKKKNPTIQTSNEAGAFCLIKLVQAVQSWREKYIHSMAWRENGQIIKYKLINVSSPCSEQWIAFRKLKR